MHVIAIHTIHDPDGFKNAGEAAFGKGPPPPFKLPIFGLTNDTSKGVCVWEGPSVKAVQELVDGVLSKYSKNEYFEMTMHGM